MLSATKLLSEHSLQELLQLALVPIFAGNEEVYSYKNLINGVLHAIVDDGKREAILRGVATGLSEENMVGLLVLAPYGKSTWKLVDILGQAAQTKYWSEVRPDWIHNSDAENKESVERLLRAERPRAAFSCMRFETGKLDALLVFRVLSAIAEGGKDQPGHYMLEEFWVGEAFKHLNSSAALTLDHKASLEFAYIGISGAALEWAEQPNFEPRTVH